MFDKDKTRVIQLTKSYRSTQQITDFTKHILTNGEAVDSLLGKAAANSERSTKYGSGVGSLGSPTCLQ